jgi:hypothetical protein
VVIFAVRTIVWWLNRDVLKFAACDRTGNMRPLYAVPTDADKTA